MGNLAALHRNMGRNHLALPLLRDALQRSRRVLGNRHPSTLSIMAVMGYSLRLGGDPAAGVALLEEAVAGSTAVLGADHPDTQQNRARLDYEQNELNEERNKEREGRQEDDETIADRIRKRRRRA